MKLIGIYFSAHWCPPCRQFTPVLIETYNDVNKDGKVFEVFFLSSDHDQAQFDGYYGIMPWIAVPWGDQRKADLSKQFGVTGIPKFIVMKPDGTIVDVNARNAVASKGPQAIEEYIGA